MAPLLLLLLTDDFALSAAPRAIFFSAGLVFFFAGQEGLS
jgi:hypothetical protein